ncbi:glycoside hydrolase family 32 protein [Microbacterium murale]|uniref:beta-fructofuranosidase n=1 Tax=Microbacterium murale TaxID=1081040 RepID=A0ABQ1S306_9MICO|nr:glycoside hydrolase family 32 protein [Microbacterium murale]GGD89073.1 glycosyl hydrolase family 32 [Microbacterium murale]
MNPETEHETLRAATTSDPLRPSYHFTAPAGWLNDPNGSAQRDGDFHLFYQYNPVAAVHNRIQWGHAVSRDLMRWEDRPIALRPEHGGPDADGCWSGVLVDDCGRPVIIYSGHSNALSTQTACLAYGDLALDHWRKEPANPVIAAPPAGYDVTAFRDHCVWRENDVWRQLIGSGIRDVGGCAFLYESHDLVTWRELGPLVIGDAGALPEEDPAWAGTMWECVDFFRFRPDGTSASPDAASGDPHVLIFSAWHEEVTRHPLVARGRYHDDRFEIEAFQRLDLGGRHAYAPQTFADQSGRRVLWAWMQEARSIERQRVAGWSGAMILPRRLWLDAAGVLRQEPVAEAESLRAEPLSWQEDGTAAVSSGVQTEVSLTVELSPTSAVRFSAFSTGDSGENTCVELGRSAEGQLRLVLDRSHSSLDSDLDLSGHEGELPSAKNPITMRILLDRSSIEVFADGIALTSRVYPARGDATGIRVEAVGEAVVRKLRGWHLAGVEQAERV